MSTAIAFHVDPELKVELETVAEQTQRSESSLLNDALRSYLAGYAEIRAAIMEADQVGTIPHEEVDAWMASWGTDHELPMPTVKPRAS